MRIETINAFSYEEAKSKAREMGFNVIKNVTSTFKKNPTDDYTDFAQKIFERDKITDVNGIAYMIVVEPGCPDTRTRPYEINNIVPKGSLTKKRVFEVRTSTDKYVGEAPNKAAAIKIAKERMSEFKEDLFCRQIYKVDRDHEIAFVVNYVPGIHTKLGTYVVFGN